jgi:hypothetical protein
MDLGESGLGRNLGLPLSMGALRSELETDYRGTDGWEGPLEHGWL